MPSPRLLHPIPILIRQIDRKFTPKYDNRLKEPIGQSPRLLKPVKLRAQMKIGRTDDAQATGLGIEEKSDGYALFLVADLKRVRITINRGDRIVQIGEGVSKREVDFYIVKFEFRGHYPSARGHTLIKAHFQDRHPSRQRGDL